MKNKEPVIEDKSIKIWESNLLAVAPTNSIMHQISTKIYLWTIYQTVKQKKLNKDNELVGSFDFKEFSEYFKIKVNNLFRDSKKITKEVRELRFFVKDSEVDEEWKDKPLFTSFSYKKGTISVSFNKTFTKHLLNLKENKIFIELSNFIENSNPRFLKLYEYLKAKVYSGQDYRKIKITLDNLYRLFVILDGNYQKYANFKQKVLIPVINSFNRIEDLKIDKWEEVKLSRKVVAINFWVSNYSYKILEQGKKLSFNKIACTKCKAGYLVIRRSKNKYPPIIENEIIAKELLYQESNIDDETIARLIEREFGPPSEIFYACNRYPKCKWTMDLTSYDNLVFERLSKSYKK